MTPTEFAQNIADLQSVVHVICGMTRLYYQHLLPKEFQKEFLGMERRWLEPLIRQLTYISSFVQDFTVITMERLNIASEKSPPASLASIEDLLFVRIRKEWEKRNSYSRLLEDIQVAELLGRHFKSRFHRAISYRIASTSDMRRVTLPRLLKEVAKSRDPEKFKDLLSEFVRVLLNTDASHMGSLYSVVTELESLAAFLIMNTCSPVSLLPYYWLMANTSWMMDSNSPTQPLDFFGKVTYIRCLFILAEGFCRLLGQLKTSPLIQADGLPLAPDLLRQRNAELLALISVNLATDKELKFGSSKIWTTIKEARLVDPLLDFD